MWHSSGYISGRELAVVGNTSYYCNMVIQGSIWLLTLPHYGFTPYLPPNCSYIKGQLEEGEGGFVHWQVIVHFKRSVRPNCVRETFGDFHHELTRSEAAEEYVWKVSCLFLFFNAVM